MILVTGANSLLGTNVVAELLERGCSVRVLVRRTNAMLENTEVVMGDVNSPNDLRRAMQGCRAVIHIAAITAQDLLSIEDYSFNWECAERVAEMAMEQRVERMIFVSSANTIGNGTDGKSADETQPLGMPYAGSLYAQSKVKAEMVVLEKYPKAIIINPGFMLGAYDSKPSSGEIITRALNRSFVVAPSGGKSFIYVRDVARAIANALDSGRYGERYLATGRAMSVEEFYRLMQKVTGRKFRIVVIPSWMIIAAGYAGDLLRFVRVKTAISSVNMRILCQREYYDNSKIRTDLKMPFTPISQAIADAVEWFDRNPTDRSNNR